MASKIEELTIKEICDKYGVLASKIGLLTSLSAYKPNDDRIEEFLKKFYPLDRFATDPIILNNVVIGTKFDFDAMLNFTSEYEDIFDKNLYVFRLYKSVMKGGEYIDLNGIVDTVEGFNRRGVNFSLAIIPRNTNNIDYNVLRSELGELLRTVDILDASEDMEINLQTYEARIITSQDYIGNSKSVEVKNREAERRFRQIDKRMNLEELAYLLEPSDLVDICRYPVLGSKLKEKIFELSYDKEKNLVSIDRISRKETPFNQAEESSKSGTIYSTKNFYKVLKANYKYMEPDKLLIIALDNYYRDIIKNQSEIDYDEILKLKEFSRKVEGLLQNKELIFDRNVTKKEGPVSFKAIKAGIDDLVSHYINGKLHSDKEIAQIRENLLSGEMDCQRLSLLDYANAMKFSMNELFIIISKDSNALEHFLSIGLIRKEEVKKFLQTQEEFADNQVLALYKNGIIGNNQLLTLYNEERISIENIKFVSNNMQEPQNLAEMVSADEFVRLYTEPEKKEEFEKYAKLFKALKIDGKSIEEKNELGLEILDASNELLDEEALYDLYHMGILPCDLLVGFVGSTALQELYSNGEIKPTDARRLFDNGDINQEMLNKVLSDPKMTDEQRLVLIFSTFPNAADWQIRENFLLHLSDAENSIHQSKNNTSGKRTMGENSTSKDNKEYVTDPCARWNFIANLDEDYSQQLLKDGTIIFYLPNRDKYIIEKLFKSNHQPAYGAATYVLSESTFNKNKADIVQDSRINRSKLVELNSENSAKKIIHKGWGKAMCRVFDIDNPTLYTPERKEEISRLAEEVEKSKRQIEK